MGKQLTFCARGHSTILESTIQNELYPMQGPTFPKIFVPPCFIV